MKTLVITFPLCLLSILFSAAASPAPAPFLVTPDIVMKPARSVLDQEGQGVLYRVGDEIVCVLEGTPREMGFQYGRLLARRIEYMATSGYMEKTLYAKGYSREYVDAQAQRMERHFPPEYIEEMHGAVDGLKAAGVEGIGYEVFRNAIAMPELQHHGPDAPPACTNFAVFGQWTPDGRLLHGRNLDWTIEGNAQDAAVVVVYRPTGEMPYMMITWAGTMGGVSGMNAAGITLGEMTSPTPDETFDGLPLLFTMRRVLQKAQSLDEAVAILRDSPRTLGWNFVVGDGKAAKAVAIEIDAKDIAVFAPDDDDEGPTTASWPLKDAVRRTNHPCGRVHNQKAASWFGAQTGADLSNPDVARLVLMNQETWKRYDWLGRQIQGMEPGSLDIPEALQLLANGPVKVADTLHSWVLDPTRATAYIANADGDPPRTATETPFTRIEFKEWF